MARQSVTVYGLVLLLSVAACCGKQRPAAGARATEGTPSSASLNALPHVTLVALSDWQAVLKPCGCTIELQRGGIERIARDLASLRAADGSVLLLHAGTLLTEDEAPDADRRQQRNLRVGAFSRMLDHIDMAAVALSSADLARGGPSVNAAYNRSHWPVLASGWKSGVKRARATTIARTASGVQVGITAVDPRSAATAKKRVALVAGHVQAMRGEGAQIIILLSNLGMRQSRKLARKVQGIDVVVIGQVPERSEPVDELERDGANEGTLLLRTPRHGAWLARLTLALNGEGKWREVSEYAPGAVDELSAREQAQRDDIARLRKGGGVSVARALPFFERRLNETRKRYEQAKAVRGKPLPAGRLAAYRAVGLPWSLTPDAAVARMVKAYDDAAAEINVKAAAKPLPGLPGKATYAGHAACVDCHDEVSGFVDSDPHYHAWETLQKVNKTRDLDCVPCHVTAFRKPGGSAFDNLPQYVNVQCEACHGAGSKHVDADGEGGGVQRVPEASACRECHTYEHSPRFDYNSYRQRLRVPGHGKPAPESAEAPPPAPEPAPKPAAKKRADKRKRR